MCIFGKRTTTQHTDINSSHIMPTSEGLDQILTESAKECYQLRAGMYISDVMMEEAVFEGSASPDVLLEGFANDIWVKIKKMFQTLWATLKSWFAKARRAFELLFSSGKDFVDKFEKEIRAKSPKGFEYDGFKYTPDKGRAVITKLTSMAQSAQNEYASGLDENASKVVSSHYDALKAKSDLKDEYNTSDAKEALLKKMGADSLDELQTEITKEFRNGETEKQKFEAFSGNTKEDMISGIKGKEKSIKSIEDGEKAVDQAISRAIKAIDSAAGKFKGDEYSKIAPYVSFTTEMMRYNVTLITTGNRVMIEMIKAGTREFESVLKSFLRFKVAKDSFTDVDTDLTPNSILESAMKFL